MGVAGGFYGGAAKKPVKPKKRKQAFDHAAALAMTQAILAAPPAKAHIVRRDAVGALLLQMIFPLEDAPTGNMQLKMSRNAPWQYDKLKRRVLARMLRQAGGRRREPLPGRPHIRAVVFSSGREDYDRGRTKVILDRLQCGRRVRPDEIPLEQWRKLEPTLPPLELGWLQDDTVDAIDLATWQEVAPRGKGCVLVEVYTGAEA